MEMEDWADTGLVYPVVFGKNLIHVIIHLRIRT